MPLMVCSFTFLSLKCPQEPRIQVNEMLHCFNVPAQICTTLSQANNTLPLIVWSFISLSVTKNKHMYCISACFQPNPLWDMSVWTRVVVQYALCVKGHHRWHVSTHWCVDCWFKGLSFASILTVQHQYPQHGWRLLFPPASISTFLFISRYECSYRYG